MLSKSAQPNLIIHPAIFPIIPSQCLLTDRPIQTASVGADTVSAGLVHPSMDETLTICCVYTFRLFSCILLTAFDALMISPVSQASWFGAALFTLELAALFYHGWNSLGSQLLTRACQDRGRVWRESIFSADFEKCRLSLSSRQSNTFEQCSSSEPFKDHFCGISAFPGWSKNPWSGF